MSYRVETASSGRAGCLSTECKKAGIKIGKDELRFGVWVDYEDKGSWKWRHWGCITGKILQNVREKLDRDGSGAYSWDALDGYAGDEKNSLDRHPDLQEKVRRVITQGFIDPEDFRGDSEMNVLGAVGLRTIGSKRKMLQEENIRKQDIAKLREQLDDIVAERNGKLAKGGSTSKLDKQLKVVQDALSEQEISLSLQKREPSIKKVAAKKRSRKDDEFEDEEPVEEGPRPVKKKRVTAKQRRELGENGADVKLEPKAGVDINIKEEEDHEMNDAKKEVQRVLTKKPKSTKLETKTQQHEIGGVREESKPVPAKRASGKVIKEENTEEKPRDEVAPATKSKRAGVAEKVPNEAPSGKLCESQVPALVKRSRKKAPVDERNNPIDESSASRKFDALATSTDKQPHDSEFLNPLSDSPHSVPAPEQRYEHMSDETASSTKIANKTKSKNKSKPKTKTATTVNDRQSRSRTAASTA